MSLRIGGKTINGPKETLLVLPRQDGDIPFRFVAILDDEPFEKLCPVPIPPRSMKVGIGMVENTEAPAYKAAVLARGDHRANWMFLESIKPSKIEWETVIPDDCSTWGNWRTELKQAGFSLQERDQIYASFLETVLVTDRMVDEARARFLASQQAKELAEQLYPTIVPESTESGGPAKDGTFVPQG